MTPMYYNVGLRPVRGGGGGGKIEPQEHAREWNHRIQEIAL